MILGGAAFVQTAAEQQVMPEPGSKLHAFWYGLTISATLVLAGGVFAGYVVISLVMAFSHRFSSTCRLTLGLMGLDELHLRVLANSSSDSTEKENAEKGMRSSMFCFTLRRCTVVLKLVSRGRHWILVVSCQCHYGYFFNLIDMR